MNSEIFPNKKTVYGPVHSWRFGQSLGIDPIFVESTCSFNCIYCQLGNIQNVTRQHKEYVPTAQVVQDFLEVFKTKKIDIITYSGSGEPTLASNLAEIINQIRSIAPNIPQGILTNATELHHPEVRRALQLLDSVTVKLDSTQDKLLNQVNRPAATIDLEQIIKGILQLQQDGVKALHVQTMFMPINNREIEQYAHYINQIKPTSVQLNTPKRPYPLSWHRENRGNHELIFNYEVKELQKLSPEQANSLEIKLRQLIDPTIPIESIYKRANTSS